MAISTAYSGQTVCMQTSVGELVFGLANDKAPITTANFLRYVNSGFYGGTVFHRIVASFVGQGGGYTYLPGQFIEKTPPYLPIQLEPTSLTGLHNTMYSIAMARTNDPNSATSQFYINFVDNRSQLDASASNGNTGYAVFGSVINGTSTTIPAMKSLKVESTGGEMSIPDVPPVIYWVYQLK
ncbi:peptidylprolyl isomerase [Burkholderiaceae bacterium DAT-1]|nr:peptidylprolyl isomerase [Burkholderiaceae bacterium DAT-1]